MSSNPVSPSISEKIKARKQTIVKKTIGDLGEVGIRRISTSEMRNVLKHPKEEQYPELIAACVVDENDKPVFGSAKEIDPIEYATYALLVEACEQENNLQKKVDNAKGN